MTDQWEPGIYLDHNHEAVAAICLPGEAAPVHVVVLEQDPELGLRPPLAPGHAVLAPGLGEQEPGEGVESVEPHNHPLPATGQAHCNEQWSILWQNLHKTHHLRHRWESVSCSDECLECVKSLIFFFQESQEENRGN